MQVIEMLLAAPEINVNHTADKGFTALYVASQKGRAEVVKRLLAVPGIKINSATRNGSTPLIMASQNGQKDAVALLLAAAGIDYNRGIDTGLNSLILASQYGHVETVALLLAQPDIDINHAASDGSTAISAASRNGHAQVCAMLLAAHQSVGVLNTQLGVSVNGVQPAIAIPTGSMPTVNARARVVVTRDASDFDPALHSFMTGLGLKEDHLQLLVDEEMSLAVLKSLNGEQLEMHLSAIGLSRGARIMISNGLKDQASPPTVSAPQSSATETPTAAAVIGGDESDAPTAAVTVIEGGTTSDATSRQCLDPPTVATGSNADTTDNSTADTATGDASSNDDAKNLNAPRRLPPLGDASNDDEMNSR